MKLLLLAPECEKTKLKRVILSWRKEMRGLYGPRWTNKSAAKNNQFGYKYEVKYE